ncbi:MAG: 4-(cytidine 5'-diphospho)-2-C-methyl-D-erythritol kinase [bacterium]|nr:4-(cytidine 5'-diphospho)-2-C-methyl-D-erythritol kinase [bacterium]
MPVSSMRIKVKAMAKVNLALEISAALPDGYHGLDTVFQALELSDLLILEKATAEESGLKIIDRVGAGFKVFNNSDNLVLRAQRKLEDLVGYPLPCKFTLCKNIPAGGGLGGGSADAAAALKGLNKLYKLNLEPEVMHSAAASLGADVAFGLVEGTARGLGRGDQITSLPVPAQLKYWGVLLVIPPFSLSTPEVYKAWDRLADSKRHPAVGSALKLVELLEERNEVMNRRDWELVFLNCLKNDLYPAAQFLYPRLKTILQGLTSWGCSAALLCGSGSTVFGLISPEVYKQVRLKPKLLSPLRKFGRIKLTQFSLKSQTNKKK